MAEYIIDEEDLAGVEPPIYPEKDYEFPERIVRCKDCRHFKKRSPVVTADDCRCCNPKWMNGRLWSVQVSPDGFCAWGEENMVKE